MDEKEYYLSQFKWLKEITDKYNDTAKYFIDLGYKSGYEYGKKQGIEIGIEQTPTYLKLKAQLCGMIWGSLVGLTFLLIAICIVLR